MRFTFALGALFGLAACAEDSPPSGKWHELADIADSPRGEHTTVALSPSTLAIVGGVLPQGDPLETTDRVQLYDIPSDSWSAAPRIPVPLNHLNLAMVDGKVYLLGGLAVLDNGTWSATADCWVLDPRDGGGGDWTPLEPMPNGTARGSAAVGVHGKSIYLAGGETINVPGAYQDSVTDVSAFDTEAGTWRVLPGRLPEGRNHAGGAVVDSTLYVVGGRVAGRDSIRDTLFALDLERPDGEWEELPRMPTGRGGLSVAVVGKTIYAAGGEGNPAPGTDGVFNETEGFDTGRREWSRFAPMRIPRHGTSVVAVDGCIYFPGGSVVQGGPPVNATDKFCPEEDGA
ncbi:hypothetical protein CDD83_8259 [Cordyceps sp. RAO-2017]|nr:hypothetical protein CDD83_8259 [Cordyceps sp. RAO-2017]